MKNLLLHRNIRWLLVILMWSPILLRGQSIVDLFNGYSNRNAIGYLEPLEDCIVSNLHTGVREWSKMDTSFYFHFGLHLVSSFPTEKMKKFSATTIEGFEPEQSHDVPTIIGPNEIIRAEGINGTAYYYPVGYGLKRMPFVLPQLTFGGIYHTELTFRFIGWNTEGDIKNIRQWGVGLRHDITPYLHNFPVEISASYFFQKFQLDPHYYGNYHLVAAHAGKSGKMWTSMITLGYQRSNSQFEYDTRDGDIVHHHVIDVQNTNPLYAEFMAGVKLWVFLIRGSVSYSGPWASSLSVHLTF